MTRSALTFALLVAASFSAHAGPLMPDFANVPTGWTTDRYQPNSFSDVGTYQGRDNVLGIGISSAQNAANRSGTGQSAQFYDTQGEQHAVSGGAGSYISADLYIPLSWDDSANGDVRTDMWGVMTDATNNVTDYPIIGFTNYGGSARFRVWEENIGNWVDLATPVGYNGWTAFEILFTGTSYEYFIDNALVYTDSSINGSTGFSAVIMQAYNFGDPTNIPNANPVDYTAYWSNTQSVPEPASLALLGLGLAGLSVARRRKA